MVVMNLVASNPKEKVVEDQFSGEEVESERSERSAKEVIVSGSPRHLNRIERCQAPHERVSERRLTRCGRIVRACF